MTKDFMWDKVVRITHWSVAILFLTNYVVTEAGSEIHQWVGYCVLSCVGLRLLWGLVARAPARLSSFPPSPRHAIDHLKEVLATRKDEHVGHNPAGAIMIWCMWLGLIVTGVSGYMMETDRFWGVEWVEYVHVGAANISFACVCIHVTAIALMSRLTGRSYVRSMLWKKKNH